MEMLVKTCVLQFYNTPTALPLFRHMSIKCNLGKTDLPMSKTSHVLLLAFFLHACIVSSSIPWYHQKRLKIMVAAQLKFSSGVDLP